MLGAIGDLVEDVVVRLHGPINVASDTGAEVTRRRGGSAANVVEAACRAGGSARFIGQIGDDATGEWLVAQLWALGADVAVRRAGRSGSVVVLVHPDGERTMLSDRAACIELRDPESAWLDDLTVLHVPYYSLTAEPLASTATTLAAWAVKRRIAVSVDASSAALLEADGPDTAAARIVALAPSIVLANEHEAAVLGPRLDPAALRGATVVVKRGARPATVERCRHARRSMCPRAARRRARHHRCGGCVRCRLLAGVRPARRCRGCSARRASRRGRRRAPRLGVTGQAPWSVFSTASMSSTCPS